MQQQTDWGDLIGVIAIFVVFVLLPLIARLLKVKKYEVGKPSGEEGAQPELAEEGEIISEIDRFIRIRKAQRERKKQPPAPEPVRRIEPVIQPVEKPPPRRPAPLRETTAEARTPLTQIVKDLPDAAQAIILAEIVGAPKALQRRPTAPFISPPGSIGKQAS